MSRPCHVLRVFTRGDEGGNHLGVVVDAIALSTDRMQAIATDLGFSETVFIDWTDTTDHPKVRIFTPADELPFAGHPLVGISQRRPRHAARLQCCWYSPYDPADLVELLASSVRPPAGRLQPVATVPADVAAAIPAALAARL